MLPNTVTLSNAEAVITVVLFSAAVVGCISFWMAYLNETRRRKFEKEMAQRRLVQLERFVEFHNAQSRLENTVRQQQADQPAVTLPVTHCERRERRRRFLPLEGNANGTG